jgi:hypothetical protein
MTWLSDGEYVIRAAAARKIGLQNLNRANRTGDLSGQPIITSGGKQITLIYNANSDPSLIAEQNFMQSMQRAKAVVADII